MLVSYVTVFCVLLGAASADFKHESVCFGRSLLLPISYTPPFFDGQLYVTPKNSGTKKLLLDKGEAKDPRLKVSSGSAKFIDLTEKDDGGLFSVSYNGARRQNIIKLTVIDCSDDVIRYYGDIYTFDIPRETEFLEFTPLDSGRQPKVLWNRTDPQISTGGKGRKIRNAWEIKNVNQSDMGHYNFRAKDNTLLSRKLLKVQARTKHVNKKENERLFIQYPSDATEWTVTFRDERGFPFTLMERGRVVINNNWYSDKWSQFGRIEFTYGVEIEPLKVKDTGTFEFTDPEGNLAKTVDVVVEQEPVSTYVYVGIGVGVIAALILCCCCVRKCCCKKSSSKREAHAPQTAATPAVYYHDMNQPAGPVYSPAPASNYSYQPVNSLVSREPTNIAPEPSVSNSVNIHVNPLQSEGAPLGGQGVDPSPVLGPLSSDPDPKFELKGLPFSSAPPLGSDSTFCDVYTSDKLNFL